MIHDDEAGQHIHILASRICAAGELYWGQNENLKSTQVISGLEHKYGLIVTKGVEKYLDAGEKTVMPASKKPKKNEIEKFLRTGNQPPRQRLQQLIDESIAGRPGATLFAEKLALAGVQVRANIASTGKMNGFSFVIDGVPFSGSQLGDKYKWSALLKRGITFDPATDAAGLERFKPQVDINSDLGDDEIRGSYSVYLIKFLNQNVKHNGIEYRWKNGAPALFDAGSSVKIIGKSSDAKIKAVLQLAAQKGWKTIRLTGSADFKRRVVLEALGRGIAIENPELQGFIKRQMAGLNSSKHQTLGVQINHSNGNAALEFVSGKVKRADRSIADKAYTKEIDSTSSDISLSRQDDLGEQTSHVP